MVIREWFLIIFTILTQMSVGSFVVLGIVHFFAARKAGAEEADRLTDRVLIAITPVLVLGILASLGHLGNPINAPRTVANFGSSWLSREIFFSMLFAGFVLVFAFLQWRKIGSASMRNAFALVGALVGLVLVFVMTQVYMLRTIPVWNNLGSPVAFYTTTFLLGSLAVGAALVANYAFLLRKDPGCEEVQCTLLRGVLYRVALAVVVLLGVELISLPLQLAYLASGPAAAVNGVGLIQANFSILLGLRLLFVFLGAGILGVMIFRYASAPGKEKLLGNLVYAAFALVLVAEVMGRYIFYASHVRVGI